MQSYTLQIVIPFPVSLFSGLLIVLCAINFDNQFCLSTIKVNNVMPDHFLPVYRHRQAFEKVIP